MLPHGKTFLPMMREWCATVNGEDHELQVEAIDGDRWLVVIGGRQREVDAVEIRPGSWSLLVDGASWVVDLDRRRQGVRALVGGTQTDLTVEDARRKRLASAVSRDGASGASGNVVRAPIAGKVVKLLVEVGASVEPGQAVAVLEAMKMENELKAAQAGEVKTIHVQTGQSVEAQEALITIG